MGEPQKARVLDLRSTPIRRIINKNMGIDKTFEAPETVEEVVNCSLPANVLRRHTVALVNLPNDVATTSANFVESRPNFDYLDNNFPTDNIVEKLIGHNTTLLYHFVNSHEKLFDQIQQQQDLLKKESQFKEKMIEYLLNRESVEKANQEQVATPANETESAQLWADPSAPVLVDEVFKDGQDVKRKLGRLWGRTRVNTTADGYCYVVCAKSNKYNRNKKTSTSCEAEVKMFVFGEQYKVYQVSKKHNHP